ncbi:MAG: glycosyltransferase [Ferruginibacter sp.]
MIAEKINKSPERVRILVAPLDWGLGHATRCIPIITILLQHNADVVLAASGSAEILLQEAFPQLTFFSIPAYKIKYSTKKKYFFWSLVKQLPHIIYTIYAEHRWLKTLVKTENISAVISDNRPGLFCRNTVTVYITHQLQIQTKKSWLSIARWLHYYFINRFDSCWVPDVAGDNNLAGALSHPTSLPVVPLKYIGYLSRFQKKNVTKKYDLLLLLSGPEPQRTILENLLLSSINKDCNYVIVRGLPQHLGSILPAVKNAFNYLGGAALNELIQQSEVVVGRAGYSTVMDMVALQQKALLIPTPGQTEQEYLGLYLSGNGIFATMEQGKLSAANLASVLENVPTVPTGLFSFQEQIIIDWLQALK